MGVDLKTCYPEKAVVEVERYFARGIGRHCFVAVGSAPFALLGAMNVKNNKISIQAAITLN